MRAQMKKRVNYTELLSQHLTILKSLEYTSGLFLAAPDTAGTGYDKSWLRDNFYECLAFEVLGDYDTVKKTYTALLTIFKKHEAKIDWAIAEKPTHTHQYIHARYHPETFEEFWEEWGNKQNDAVGAILFSIGRLEKKKKGILKTTADKRIVQKLVKYLESIRYWEDGDSGMWEEWEEIHASSIGACVAGLKAVQGLVEVPADLIEKGEETLRHILPRESGAKFVDLALLSLIYPYNVVLPHERAEILKNVEYHLVKRHGVIRYKNDRYYNKNPDGHSEEAEWTFGFSWLAIIYNKLRDEQKAKFYFDKALATITPEGTIPELYFSNSEKCNENNPLGWSESLFIVALHNIYLKHLKVDVPVKKQKAAKTSSKKTPKKVEKIRIS